MNVYCSRPILYGSNHTVSRVAARHTVNMCIVEVDI